MRLGGFHGLGLGISTRGGGGVNTNFEILVDTTKAGSAADTMIIPTVSGIAYDFTVNWGDGNSEDISSSALSSFQHTYDTGGEYTIKISGTFPRIYFNDSGDKLKLLKVENFGIYGEGVANQTSAFNGCSNLSSIANDFKGINDVLITGDRMFRKCSALTALPDNMTLHLLREGTSMFDRTNLLELPANMTLASLIVGSYMFDKSGISEIPQLIDLNNLQNGNRMFGQLGNITILSDMNLSALLVGNNMFLDTTIDTEDYSNLLINMEANNTETGVAFHGGDSKYNAAGEVARDQLTLPVIDGGQGWTVTDAGLEV